MSDLGRCSDCRYWNGTGSNVSYCFKVRGQRGAWWTVPKGEATFYTEVVDVNGPFLMTGPDFGCTLFELGKPRWWGDNGEE